MDNILKSGATNLLAGFHGNHQATLGAELAFTHLGNGGSAVALLETGGDVTSLTARCGEWLKARDCDPAAIQRLAFVTNYRAHHDPAKLADAITEVATDAPLLVWCDISNGPYLAPDHAWFTRALALLDHLPGATVLTVCSVGVDGMPMPSLSNFPADVVYQVRSSGVGMRLTVTPVVPLAPAIQLVGKIAVGGAVLIDQKEETEHV